MRILGIDTGSKRMGFALSDELGITAQGLSTIEYLDRGTLFDKIKDIVVKFSVKEIIVGLPINMDGSRGEQAEKTIEFCEMLKNKIDIPIKLWDERMSTLEVERIMIQADISRNKRKKKIDKLAAQVMLQSYLDSLERNKENN